MPKRPAATRTPTAKKASTFDDNQLRRMLKSVHSGKGGMYTTHLAQLLADRGNFAVTNDGKRELAVYSESKGVWVVDRDAGGEVAKALEAALAVLEKEVVAALDLDDDDDDDDCAPALEVSLATKASLEEKLLPQQLRILDRFLAPTEGNILCADGVLWNASEPKTQRSAVAADHCVSKTGFSSTALSDEELSGYTEWRAEWKEVKARAVVDATLARAIILGKPAMGQLLAPSAVMSMLERTVGTYKLSLPGPDAGFMSFALPSGTTPDFLARAALEAWRAAPKQAFLIETISGMHDFLTKTPPEVQACNTLYYSLRTSAVAREKPLENYVTLAALKSKLDAVGNYGSKAKMEALLANTFTPPLPIFRNGSSDRKIKDFCWVLTGVAMLDIAPPPPACAPAWVPMAMLDSDADSDALQPE